MGEPVQPLSVEEINFSRLLRNTEKALIQYKDRKASGGVVQEHENVFSTNARVFDGFLRKLNEQWKQLAASDSVEDSKRLKRLHGGPPPSQMSLAAYKNKMDHLQQIYDSILEIEEAEANTRPTSEFGSSSSFAFDKHSPSSAVSTSSVSQLLTEREDLFSSMCDTEANTSALSVEDMIKKHREIQEQLTSDILLMVSALKETSIQSLNIVTDDNSRLETVEQEVAENIEMVGIYDMFHCLLIRTVISNN